jgi:2'-5' RNA ligase
MEPTESSERPPSSDPLRPAANWFIALPVAAGAWFERLQAPPGVRLFGRNDLHITVAFLGAVSEQLALSAFELGSALPLAALDIQLARVEALGSARRPSALSALVGTGRQCVEEACTAVRDGMWERAQAKRDTRPALAHVTLARAQRRATRAEWATALRWAHDLELGAPSCRLDRIALYTWSDDRAQSLFRVHRERPLRSS